MPTPWFDVDLLPAHTPLMHRRGIVRIQSLVLAVLIGITSTGLPSHHHENDDLTPVLADADHHGHGVQLVDHGDRLRSDAVSQAALPPARPVDLGVDPGEVSDVIVPSSDGMMWGRAPPPTRPRAPPVSD
jgi:hypothetical protein